MANVFEPEWDAERDAEPFRWKRAQLGQQSGARELGASLFEVPPGAATFPLHAHFANEELLVVLAGRPTLRTREGARELRRARSSLSRGPRRRAPARQPSDEPVRLLIVSTMRAPEINAMLEDNTYWLRDYVPGTDPPDGAFDVWTTPD